ncbi:hypothetical protein J4233_04195 [Candidatus Pacearchaeota archaeon]|nr:hypothetical protein [Candidatus Pacearchaeota archaeon]
MPKFCEVCDTPIRTGRKYCWRHRNSGYGSPANTNKPNGKLTLYLLLGAMAVIFLIVAIKFIGAIVFLAYKNTEAVGLLLFSLLLWALIIAGVVYGVKYTYGKLKSKKEGALFK